MKFNEIFNRTTQWFSATPERALDRAYRAALKIKEIEDKYFNGQPVSSEGSEYGESVITYFKNIEMGLVEFKASRLFMNLSNFESYREKSADSQDLFGQESMGSSAMLEKLKFIDNIKAKYKVKESQNSKGKIADYTIEKNLEKGDKANLLQLAPSTAKSATNNSKDNPQRATEKTGVLPRSFLKTIDKIKQEIDPKSTETEKKILNQFRNSRYKTAISIKFILLLIIIPILTHQLTKTVFLSPIVEKYFEQNSQIIFINHDLEEEAFGELKTFEEALHFKGMIGLIPKITPEEIEEKVKEKAVEISQNYRQQGINGIANIFADLFSLSAFAGVLIARRQELEIVKSFLDEIFYSLSDSAKAFLIILFTDMFVGFHSPHGWEVILESISRHFGLPENREFNFLFIATFPVILDTILKYWIFRYLNRISPSAVATYRNMNE